MGLTGEFTREKAQVGFSRVLPGGVHWRRAFTAPPPISTQARNTRLQCDRSPEAHRRERWLGTPCARITEGGEGRADCGHCESRPSGRRVPVTAQFAPASKEYTDAHTPHKHALDLSLSLSLLHSLTLSCTLTITFHASTEFGSEAWRAVRFVAEVCITEFADASEAHDAVAPGSLDGFPLLGFQFCALFLTPSCHVFALLKSWCVPCIMLPTRLECSFLLVREIETETQHMSGQRDVRDEITWTC